MSNGQKKSSSIVDGIGTGTGAQYYKFRGRRGDFWFSGQSWIDSENKVRQQICTATGTMISQTATIADLRKQVDEWKNFRRGLVAEHPGWLGNMFVCGDGTWRAGKNQPALDVVAFEHQPKFIQRGTLGDWRRSMAPFVSGQALPFFVCCLALSGPLLRFLPSGLVPPQIELVGERTSGKSTVGMLAASVWSGMPGKTEGGGENWDMTVNAYDVHRRNHRDMFLLLDEAETSAVSSANRRDVAKMIVMKGASTATKVRYTDTHGAPQLRVPILSTTNTPLLDVLHGAGADAIAAATSRMMSLRMTKSASGVTLFDTAPPGYDDMEDAVRALRSAVDETYGSVGPAFAAGLASLVVADENALLQRIRRGIDTARERLRRQRPDGDARHRDMLATVEVAGRLAQEFHVLPGSWGDPTAVIDFIYAQCAADTNQPEKIAESEVQRFSEYLRQQISTGTAFPLWVRHSVDRRLSETCPIVVARTEQGGIAYLRPDHFEATFPQPRRFLSEMKRQGKLVQHESERDERLQVHAPREIKKYGFKRVYAITLNAEAIKVIKAARREFRSKLPKSKKGKSARSGAFAKPSPRLGKINR